jgi:hypothetical protein
MDNDLKLLASTCPDNGDNPCTGGTCPTIYRQADDVIVQGYIYELATPAGEQAVRLPRWLLHMATQKDTEDA